MSRPRRGRPFVYTTGKQTTNISHQDRKRKWSPGSYPEEAAGTSSTGTGTHHGPHKHSLPPKPKAQKIEDNFDDDDFDMDQLGTAALDQYEMSQQISAPSTDTVDPNIHATHVQVASSGPQKWDNPYQKDSRQDNKNPTISPASPVYPVRQTGGTPAQPGNHLHDLEKLREENYAKDGEVKVLRGEKERLLGELRNREEQMREMQTRLVSETKAVQTQLTKDNDSLTAKLQFQDQELAVLREKCLLLEQHCKSPSTNKPVASSRSIKTNGRSSATDFSTTDSFIPLSATEITSVHVKTRKGSKDKPGIVSEKKPDTRSKRARISRSPTSTPMNASIDLNSRRKLSKNSNSTSPAFKTPTAPSFDRSMILNVQGKELDDTQLLMLLIRRDLLRPPIFMKPDGDESEESSDEVPDRDSQSSDEGHSQSGTDKQETSLTGLLSFLRIQPKSKPFSLLSASLTTPAKSQDVSLKDSSLLPAVDPALCTPVRHKRLQLSKPHTLARADVAKSRLEQVHDSTHIRSLSASNTPLHSTLDSKASSLLCSVDKGGLEKSIGALLQSADMSSVLRSDSATSFCPNVLYSRMHENSNLKLLKQIAAIVVQYHAEQSQKAKGSGNTSITETGDSLDSNVSPKSVSSSGTSSSKTSSDLFTPLKLDQDLASQALEILETLVSYSQSAREQVLLQPPNFSIDSQLGSVRVPLSISSSLEATSEKLYKRKTLILGEATSDLMEVSRRLSFLQREGGSSLQNSPVVCKDNRTPTEGKVWKDQQLVNIRDPRFNLSSKVWINKEHAPQRLRQGEMSFHLPATSDRLRGGYCEELFTALLEMLTPPWRESTNNVMTCLKILTALAQTCPTDILQRFAPLLEDDTIGVCLDKTDPHIVLFTLSLLRQLVRSPVIVGLLCHNSPAPCVPVSCYDICLHSLPDPGHTHLRCITQLQVVRLISNALVAENGASMLLTAPCQCTHELLKTLVLILSNLVDNVCETSQWTQLELTLVREVVSLMHKISIHDNYFDTHRLECEYTYLFVLNTLSWLLKTHPTSLKEVAMVSDLLEYTEELEDSEEQDKMETTN